MIIGVVVMRKFFETSIRNKILSSYILVLIVGVIFFGIFAYSGSRDSVKLQNTMFTKQLLSLAGERLKSQMSDIDNSLDSIQANRFIINALSAKSGAEFCGMIPQIENEIMNIDLFHKRISSIKLYTLKQDPVPDIYSSDIILHHTFSQQEPWFSQTMQSDGQTCWNIFYSSFGEGIITASRLLYDTRLSDEPIGVIRLDVDLLPFLKTIDGIQIGETGKVFIVQQNSIITIDKSSFLKDMSNEAEFFDAMRNRGDSVASARVRGEDYLIGAEKVSATNFIIGVMVPEHELDSTIYAIGRAMTAMGLASLILGILISLLLSYIIAKPISELSGVMLGFENDVNVRVKTDRQDEVGVLYKSFNKMMNKIQNLINEVDSLSRKQKNAELKALQAQINPHFLYNTLETINWLAIKKGEDDISEMISQLGNFFRCSLNKGKEFIDVERELSQVESYLAIEQIRFKDKFDVKWQIDDRILNYTMLKLTLQPIVENCIVHGFRNIDYKGTITIEGGERDNCIFFKVSDNGVGTDADYLNSYINEREAKPVGGGTYGVWNVQQRLKLYFGDKCAITFSTNKSGGVTAEILIEKNRNI